MHGSLYRGIVLFESELKEHPIQIDPIKAGRVHVHTGKRAYTVHGRPGAGVKKKRTKFRWKPSVHLNIYWNLSQRVWLCVCFVELSVGG